MPLLPPIGTLRRGTPGSEFTMSLSKLPGAYRSTTDYWVRYSLRAMLFAGASGRCPWLSHIDITYRERPVLTKGWRSRAGMLPSEYWRRNRFVRFMADDPRFQLHHLIAVASVLWGNNFPPAESTWPQS